MDVAKAVGVDVGRRFKVRVGRGSGSGLGKTSGRGMNGAASKSGFGGLLHREGGQMPLIRRLPKRGFTNSLRVEYNVVNLEALKVFADGSQVDVKALDDAGLLRRVQWPVKLLGRGQLSKKLVVLVDRASASAQAAVEKAGGTLKLTGQVL